MRDSGETIDGQPPKSGIATYSQAGAQFGLNMLWTMPLAYPLMAAIQSMCSFLGRTTGNGLAANIKTAFPPIVLKCVVLLLLIFVPYGRYGSFYSSGRRPKKARTCRPKVPFRWREIPLWLTGNCAASAGTPGAACSTRT
jgi:hypothetical protein